MNNQDLFTTIPLSTITDRNFSLMELVNQLKNERLLLPFFQRDYIWETRKLKGWIETIMNGDAIGVIVTYQLPNGGPYYLADGYQRLTASTRFLENPEEYKFRFGSDQALEYLSGFFVPVQHRIYKSHIVAMRAFQNLNSGTAATPSEYFKGELCRSSVGEKLYSRIPEIVFSYERPISEPVRGRLTQGKLLRSALALFAQYITKYKKERFWDVTSSKTDLKTECVERVLHDAIASLSSEQIDSHVRSFDSFIAGQVNIIEQSMVKTQQRGKSVSRTLMRFLLHGAIWRRNNGYPAGLYNEYIYELVRHQVDQKSILSRFFFTDKNGHITGLTVHMGNLSHMRGLAKRFNINLEPKRKNQIQRAPGFDDSQKLPFADNGDGETFPEPSSINRSRGKKHVEDGEE